MNKKWFVLFFERGKHMQRHHWLLALIKNNSLVVGFSLFFFTSFFLLTYLSIAMKQQNRSWIFIGSELCSLNSNEIIIKRTQKSSEINNIKLIFFAFFLQVNEFCIYYKVWNVVTHLCGVALRMIENFNLSTLAPVNYSISKRLKFSRVVNLLSLKTKQKWKWGKNSFLIKDTVKNYRHSAFSLGGKTEIEPRKKERRFQLKIIQMKLNYYRNTEK